MMRSEQVDDLSMMFLKVLPVLFLEYLSVSLARSLLPTMIVDAFGGYSYFIVGICETVKGLLAFLACPILGRISDRIGRKPCILIAMLGTTMPVCALAFTNNMIIYSILLSISGIFTATFALSFAYIADCVEKKNRAPAYGLALATFGLSFTIGPILGSYMAKELGLRVVFISSCLLVGVNAMYLLSYLPETVKVEADVKVLDVEKMNVIAMDYIPHSWDFQDTFRVFRADPFLANVAAIVFLYYTSVWAMVSTLMVYITQSLLFSPVSLAWLMSFYGLSTMLAEGVLVRVLVPPLGEANAIRLGLVSFAIQGAIIAFSPSAQAIYVSVAFSLLSNLVYPSLSSLVSKVVEEHEQGEALGAMNGIKALTEGFGPLMFGLFMSLFEHSPLPGAPYLISSILSLWAFLHTFELPLDEDRKGGEGFGKRREGERGGLLDGDSDSEQSL